MKGKRDDENRCQALYPAKLNRDAHPGSLGVPNNEQMGLNTNIYEKTNEIETEYNAQGNGHENSREVGFVDGKKDSIDFNGTDEVASNRNKEMTDEKEINPIGVHVSFNRPGITFGERDIRQEARIDENDGNGTEVPRSLKPVVEALGENTKEQCTSYLQIYKKGDDPNIDEVSGDSYIKNMRSRVDGEESYSQKRKPGKRQSSEIFDRVVAEKVANANKIPLSNTDQNNEIYLKELEDREGGEDSERTDKKESEESNSGVGGVDLLDDMKKMTVNEYEAILGIMKIKRIYRDELYIRKGYKYKSEFQVRVLSDILRITPYPNAEVLDAVGILLNLKPRSVQIWFQNARQGGETHLSREELKGMRRNSSIGTQQIFEIYMHCRKRKRNNIE